MKRFSELLLNLIYTTSRNDKITHIMNWISGSDTEEIGWGLSVICQELEIPKVKSSMVKEISFSHLDKYLFELSYDYVGDMAETISLIWPEEINKEKKFNQASLSQVIKDLKTITKSEAPELITNYLNNFDQNTRWTFLKIITGGLRVGVSSRIAKIALSKSFNKDINVVKILDSFFGMQYQLPPMYSALKYQGKPLYKYARAGQEIKRNRRCIDIKSIKLVSLKNSFLRIDVTCSKGTYIRTLAEDIGEKLGSCAHLYNLRRVGVGVFDIDQSININKLELLAFSKPDVLSHKLRPVDSFINHWPSMQLNVQQEKKFLNGQPIRVSPYNQRNENEYLVRVYGFSNDFLGTAQMINNEILRPKRLISK